MACASHCCLYSTCSSSLSACPQWFAGRRTAPLCRRGGWQTTACGREAARTEQQRSRGDRAAQAHTPQRRRGSTHHVCACPHAPARKQDRQQHAVASARRNGDSTRTTRQRRARTPSRRVQWSHWRPAPPSTRAPHRIPFLSPRCVRVRACVCSVRRRPSVCGAWPVAAVFSARRQPPQSDVHEAEAQRNTTRTPTNNANTHMKMEESIVAS